MTRTYKMPADPRIMPTATDLLDVRTSENGSPLMSLNRQLPSIKSEYIKPDMLDYVGDHILVRQELVEMLKKAQKMLDRTHPGYRLWVCYGYRHPDIQERYYNRRYLENKKKYRPILSTELFELTHTQVAFPEVAGHPTGGAIDITIIDEEGGELDMGTAIADYAEPEKCHYYCEDITREQRKNRKLLRKLMLKVGFAPFNGEWWHFSYGDREWAFFYHLPSSLFKPIDLKLWAGG